MTGKTETLYIFMDTANEVGGESLKFSSKDKQEVLLFIAEYALAGKSDLTSYYEIVEVVL